MVIRCLCWKSKAKWLCDPEPACPGLKLVSIAVQSRWSDTALAQFQALWTRYDRIDYMPYSIRECSTCKSEFRPSSRHRDCPACRSRSRMKKCPRCGKPMRGDSTNCSECVVLRGDMNPNWRGGKTKHSNGYVMVLVPDHPRVQNQHSNYVMEHILVMEHFLGRYLLPGENVHHLNALKTDNRIENLELWCKPQPSGARAEDLLAWAKGIVERYEGVFN